MIAEQAGSTAGIAIPFLRDEPAAFLNIRHESGKVDTEHLLVVEAEYLEWLLLEHATEQPHFSVRHLLVKVSHVAELRFQGAEAPRPKWDFS